MDLNIHWVLIFQLFFYCTAQDLSNENAVHEELVKINNEHGNDEEILSTFLNNVETELDKTPKPSECGSSPNRCPRTPYRSYDGSCNNLRNPTWGTPNTAYDRLLPARYADGIKEPPTSKSGKPLPLPRSISLLLHPDVPTEDDLYTLVLMQYGQIVTHDLSKSAMGPKTGCCSKDGLSENVPGVKCYPVLVPRHDPAHSQDTCLAFVRTITNIDTNCRAGHSNTTEQLTSVNHYLDLSITYGNNEEAHRQLREFKGGRLLTEYRNGQYWPPRPKDTSATCRLVKPTDACYFAGDVRMTLSPEITLLQIIFLREHNRIVGILSKLNPHWDDERLFQEARRINIAENQYIAYYEFLPYYIGKENALKTKLIWNTEDFVNDYNPNVDASVLNEHANAAFRNFHSLIRGTLDMVAENRHFIRSVRFADVLHRPQILEDKNGMDDLIRGFTTQAQSASNQFYDSEMTQFLGKDDNDTFGTDLKSLDIQRGRDHGLASYNDYREILKLPRAQRFEEFLDYINLENVKKLAILYENPDDVDLMVGGSLENNVPGTLVGPTFLGIIVEQFYRTRVGDRFWFENRANGLNLQQLKEIRKSSMSKLLCDNGHSIKKMQPRAFERLSSENPLLSSDSLPSVNLSLWKDVNSCKPATNYQQSKAASILLISIHTEMFA